MKRNARPRIMDHVQTTRLVQGAPGYLPTGTRAEVTATGSGRFQIEPLGLPGVRYWVDADAIEVTP